jgi:hypothetical protein
MCPPSDISVLDWAIIGGESGHGARPMKEAWVEKILKLCRKADVAFFFKQRGGIHKSTTGRLLHGRTYDEMPALSTGDIPLRKNRQSAALAWQDRTNIWLSPPHKILVPLQAKPVTCKGGIDAPFPSRNS